MIKSCSFGLYFCCSSAVHKLGELKLGQDLSLNIEEKGEPGEEGEPVKGEPGKEGEPGNDGEPGEERKLGKEEPGEEGEPVKWEPGEMLKSNFVESMGEI